MFVHLQYSRKIVWYDLYLLIINIWQGLRKDDGAISKRDLRSRGFCLLPLSRASYISGYDWGLYLPYA
jgi:hypothetical protein